jgi:hypothetical protein
MGPFKQCWRCSGQYPEEFFPVRRGLNAFKPERRGVCDGCLPKARDKTKQANRWLVKAASTARRHAKKYIDKGLATSVEGFCKKFKWFKDKIAHALEYASGNGCQECGRKFSTMGNGLSDITIDIIDREKLPFFGLNTRIICGTCNREKGKTAVDKYGAKQLGWRLFEENEKRRAADPYYGTLFQIGA